MYNHVGQLSVGHQLGSLFEPIIPFINTNSQYLKHLYFSEGDDCIIWYINKREFVKFFQSSLTLIPDHELVFAQIPFLYHRLLKMVTRHRFTKGEKLFREGAHADQLWAVAFGDIALSIKVDTGLSYISHDTEIRLAERGSLIGTETLVNHETLVSKVYCCTAVVSSPVALAYSFSKDSLNEVRKRCTSHQWISFIANCHQLLNLISESINKVKSRAAKNAIDRRLPTTAIKLTETKREYFIMGGRFRYLYKKDELGAE